MSIDDVRVTVSTQEVPRPRQSDESEPGRASRVVARPQSEYWDHCTASWRSRWPAA